MSEETKVGLADESIAIVLSGQTKIELRENKGSVKILETLQRLNSDVDKDFSNESDTIESN